MPKKRSSKTPPREAAVITSNLRFPVVGIGASAGGLQAVQQLLERMPVDSGMAFVVVLHLSPRHESHAGRILQRATGMEVTQVTSTTLLEPNRVYVISPRLHLAMSDGHLRVMESDATRGPLVAIDLFFRTLAEAHRELAIGVVMSGTGADGTLGVARIKERGGVTMAQSPADSEFEEMPKNAVASGNIDFVLAATDIPAKLLEIWDNARGIRLPMVDAIAPRPAVENDPRPAAEAALREIVNILNARTGHDFSNYKRATLLRRMERRMQVRLLRDLPAYRDYLNTHVDETSALLADLLISVTNFFRDRDGFEVLTTSVIPALFAGRDPSEPVRVWVAGCATGEEAYSLAMLLQDEVTRLGAGHQFQVFASDIDEQAIATARRALYPASIIADVSAEHLGAYFTLENGHYRVRKPLREKVLFAAHNALRDPPFSRLDMVSCRNVMIYLERDIQQLLLQVFHYALHPGGILFLGGSESADSVGGMYEAVDKRHRVFRAVSSEQRRPLSLPLRVAPQPVSPATLPPPPSKASPAAAIHQRILELYAPPSVIVDASDNVVHMSEHAGRFLQVPAGVPSHHLLAMIRPDLQQALRGAMLRAAHARRSVESTRVRLERDGHFYFLTMIVRPFTDPESGLAHTLVLFEEVEDTMAIDDDTPRGFSGNPSVALLLESELQRTREQLQTHMELSDTATEELKASNEELQAMNEELRSASEELETSTEELQSVNEELITVNAELKIKIEETERINDDLRNFMAATDVATIFVDEHMAIKRYTPQSEALFRLISTDVGRPLTDITHRLDFPTLAEDVGSTIDGQHVVEREMRSVDGRWWIARIRPYQASARGITGAILTFVDVTTLRTAEDTVARSNDQVRHAVQSSKDVAVIVTDGGGTIVGWNEGAERVFMHTPGQALGQPIDIIFVAEDIEAGRPQFEMRQALDAGRSEDERWHLRRDGSRVYCSGVLTAVVGGDAPGFVKIVRDVTAQQEEAELGQRELRRAREHQADAEAAIALKDEFLAVMSHELKHPLNLISVNAEILARSPELGGERSPSVGKALRTIARAIRTQTKIIDDLLDLSRMRTGKLTLERAPVDLVPLVELAAETAAADAAAAEIHVGFRARESHVVVHGDHGRLNQVVWNLLSNAIKFTPAGGRIDVEVDVDGGHGRVDVTDTGIGIEPSALPRIFEMFGQARTRASSSQGGLGIGLSLVRQLAEHHGGRVEVHSPGPGQGSRFSVWIPLYVEAALLPVGDAIPQASGNSCGGLTLLVVDDDPSTVEALATLLELEGASVLRADSAGAALERLRGASADLVVTDLGMPGQDGYALLESIRADPATAAIPVIALTGFGRPGDVQRALDAGFDSHLGKPVDFARLLALIADLAARPE